VITGRVGYTGDQHGPLARASMWQPCLRPVNTAREHGSQIYDTRVQGPCWSPVNRRC